MSINKPNAMVINHPPKNMRSIMMGKSTMPVKKRTNKLDNLRGCFSEASFSETCCDFNSSALLIVVIIKPDTLSKFSTTYRH